MTINLTKLEKKQLKNEYELISKKIEMQERLKLMRLIIILNENSDITLFLNFNGHINTIKINIYYGGWKTNKDPDTELEWSSRSKDFEFSSIYKEVITAYRLFKKTGIKTLFKPKYINNAFIPDNPSEFKNYHAINTTNIIDKYIKSSYVREM